jgi:hypothetical protein
MSILIRSVASFITPVPGGPMVAMFEKIPAGKDEENK